MNYRFSTKSYKDKRKIEHPREECLVFENTHPAIISKEVWDIVQRVRKNKRRRTKMDEQNKYSGLVICADCRKTMVLHRAHTMSADYKMCIRDRISHGRTIRVVSVFPKSGSQTAEEKLRVLAALELQRKKSA